MAGDDPGEEGGEVVGVPGTEGADAEPFEVDFEAGPGACCGGEEFVFGGAVDGGEVREPVEDGVVVVVWSFWGGRG